MDAADLTCSEPRIYSRDLNTMLPKRQRIFLQLHLPHHFERGMFGHDEDVGFYGYDDWSTNAADWAFCTEALDSCWDKSG